MGEKHLAPGRASLNVTKRRLPRTPMSKKKRAEDQSLDSYFVSICKTKKKNMTFGSLLPPVSIGFTKKKKVWSGNPCEHLTAFWHVDLKEEPRTTERAFAKPKKTNTRFCTQFSSEHFEEEPMFEWMYTQHCASHGASPCD
jgi:hypothetical protein